MMLRILKWVLLSLTWKKLKGKLAETSMFRERQDGELTVQE